MFHTLENEELISLKNTFAQFGSEHKHDLARAWHESVWPEETWLHFCELRTLIEDIDIENKYSILKVFSAIEGFCKGSGDSSFCTSLIVQFLLCTPILRKYFPNYAISKSDVMCFALTEPHGGSAPFDFKTQLIEKKQTINSIKWHITNAPCSDHILIFGKTKKSKKLFMGITSSSHKDVRIRKLNAEAMKNSPVGTIKLWNAKIENCVVSTKETKEAISNAFLLERLGVGFAAIGTVEHHLEHLVKYVRNRQVSNKRIIKYQYIQKRLTDIKINLDALKSLVKVSLEYYKQGKDISSLASQVKLKAIDNVRSFCLNAISCYGSYGIQRNVGLMRVLNDSMGGSIAGGTEEIHRNMIFGKMIRDF